MNKKYDIMIVDDSAFCRKTLSVILKQLPETGYCFEAINGLEFLNTLTDWRPDIVLMDIDMPVLNGIEATMISCRRYPQIKIIGVSSFEAKENAALMLKAGAMAVINKPANRFEITKAINSVMRNKFYVSSQIFQKINANKV